MNETDALLMEYLYEVIDYLDGRGLIITDDEMIVKELNDFAPFKRLKNIVMFGEDV
jgi:hypothetical protein